ncbi:conserved hypothetical protein [Burkholderia pseudomallei 1106b]|uniref:Uncharacterized protein n=1 Tax=Burkholderia pseudomallei (strain 1106a) TaxID=357348 RepID=A3P9Y9_BURP0|nr:conserved hypothetical protein [Burkholderia pseudomallei 1106a]AFR20989.1 hypothetical protein BPC006_II3066 [Burkholderia pseudomallei BPC006]EES22022.1 conserved hypothetical protein [Burkholderia pseudomallei 1106b]
MTPGHPASRVEARRARPHAPPRRSPSARGMPAACSAWTAFASPSALRLLHDGPPPVRRTRATAAAAHAGRAGA